MPPPSAYGSPILSCRMTDRDVVERVAAAFGTSVGSFDKGRHRTEYAVTVKGSRAAALMADLKPIMGVRRQTAIERSLNAHVPPAHKLNFSQAEEIRRRHAAGETVAALSRSTGVSRSTIRAVIQGRIHSRPPAAPWRVRGSYLNVVASPPVGFSSMELSWLAGWLEGEGSFMKPPPSDPRRPRISAEVRDADVATEVGRLLDVTPTRQEARRFGWSDTFRVLKRGGGAIALMEALAPIMGARRIRQIQEAIRAAERARTCHVSVGWNC